MSLREALIGEAADLTVRALVMPPLLAVRYMSGACLGATLGYLVGMTIPDQFFDGERDEAKKDCARVGAVIVGVAVVLKTLV